MLAARMMLSGAASQIGWILFGFGTIFVWGFALQADFSGWRFRAGSVAQTAGQAVGCVQTHFTEGGSETRRGTPIYENHYRYMIAGQEVEGVSYAEGRCVTGGTVTVEYLLAEPAVSRIAGMRRRPLSPLAGLVLVLPATGLIMVITALVKGRRSVWLLREGLPAEGRLIDKTPTRMRVNHRVVYRMTFEYTALSGARRATVRTHEPERFEDEPRKLLLYDPVDLDKAQLLLSFPRTIALDGGGQPVAHGSLAFLLLPALVILGNAWYVYRNWIAGP
jgi:hypothetical protein